MTDEELHDHAQETASFLADRGLSPLQSVEVLATLIAQVAYMSDLLLAKQGLGLAMDAVH